MGEREEALVARIVEAFGASRDALVGIGDDAAVLELGRTVVTTDLLIENVDFTRAIPLRFTGAKSLAANVSDLAAMGAVPASFLMALGIPGDQLDGIDRLIEGMADAARAWRIELVGGDLSAASELTIAITAIGLLENGVAPLRRNGARRGEAIFVSRPLGAAAAGLHLLGRGWRIDSSGMVTPPGDLPGDVGYSQREFAAAVIRRQVSPEPEHLLGPALARARLASACIDISDGLSTDLHRLCDASGVGAEIEWARIPRFPDLERIGFSLGIDESSAVLHGGEELALLFTSAGTESELSKKLGRPVYRIGRTTAAPGVKLARNEKTSDLPRGGFDHFARREV
ncbi:MAG: thiamine-phosphate kinase [Thermoanaerobaculia bacterium]